MNANASINNALGSNFNESSFLRSPRDTDNAARQWLKNKRIQRALTNVAQGTNQNANDIRKLRRRILGGGAGTSGFSWQTPNKELDPTVDVAKNTFVYISPLNTLVTAGMTDVVTNANVISCEGVWQAAQSVPSATGGQYNVPVFPYPSGMGMNVPSGAPLTGDLDSTTIFWIYWGQIAC
jgi:hypothetical protein